MRVLNSPSRHLRPAARRAALQSLLLLGLLASCGGGSDDAGPDFVAPPPPPALPGVVVSAASPVAAGCNGGRAGGTLFVNAEVEPMVAISPADPELLIGAWQQDRASDGGARALVSALSRDGGHSWSRTLHPLSRCGGALPGSAGDFERATDPWVDIGLDGTLHVMALSFSGGALQPGSSSAMLAQRSTDGGLSWSAPALLVRDGDTLFNDKNTLTADRTDARYVYAVWDRLDLSGNGPTLLARSVDAGATWEPAREIYVPRVTGGVSQTIGNRIVAVEAGPERGVLVNVFTQIDTAGGSSQARVRVVRSTDKGLTWEAPVTVAEHRGVGTRDPDTGAGIRDGGIIPSIAAGTDGRLWVAWQDARFSGGARDAILVSRSADGGRSWSAPVVANREPGVAAFTPVLAALPDGRVALLHHDLRSNTPSSATLPVDLWLLSSTDGVAWAETAVTRGHDIHSAPLASGGRFLGDYQGLAAGGSNLLALAALPLPGAANPTEVVAVRLAAPAAALAAGDGRATRAQARTAPDTAAFARARSEAIGRAMDARVPGWRQRVGQRTAPRQP